MKVNLNKGAIEGLFLEQGSSFPLLDEGGKPSQNEGQSLFCDPGRHLGTVFLSSDPRPHFHPVTK